MEDDLDDLPKYERPPLIETAMGVQFAPIANFTAGHYGWFWKRYLDEYWTKVQDAVRSVNQFEKFGEQGSWQQFPPQQLVIQGTPQPDRILIFDERNDRIIQLQNDRFFYNWRKGEADYPSFAKTYPEFRLRLRSFEDFLRECGLDAPIYSQWEFTYFNAIPKGELWDSPANWADIFPGLFGRLDHGEIGLVCESSSGMLKFEIPPKKGRVYVAGQLARMETGQEILQLNLTARGPVITGDEGWSLEAGITSGHTALVRTFHRIASASARSHWGER
jgi:uncharacterized protein (TIGR04255 family)